MNRSVSSQKKLQEAQTDLKIKVLTVLESQYGTCDFKSWKQNLDPFENFSETALDACRSSEISSCRVIQEREL